MREKEITVEHEEESHICKKLIDDRSMQINTEYE